MIGAPLRRLCVVPRLAVELIDVLALFLPLRIYAYPWMISRLVMFRSVIASGIKYEVSRTAALHTFGKGTQYGWHWNMFAPGI
jgi:hypothetical protein